MNQEDRFAGLGVVNDIIDRTGVELVWDLQHLAERLDPPVGFDLEIGYAILGIVAASSIVMPNPVKVNKPMISELYEITLEELNQYFDWLCHIGLLRAYE